MEPTSHATHNNGGYTDQETIMLVEDDPVVLNTTARVLKRLGFAVLPYERAGEALASAQMCGHKIHLLITDVLMPEMNGDHLARNIRQHMPDLRILFMSGYAEDILDGACTGKPHFVSKPFTPQELADKVRMVLSADC